MTETWERRGTKITMEDWSLEEVGLPEKVIGRWVEFCDGDGVTILKISKYLWDSMPLELRGKLIGELMRTHG